MADSAQERLGYDVKSTEVAFMAAKAAALRPVGLSVAQYVALLALRDNPGISGAGIARACLVTPQASAATLKTLETQGLIVRKRDDWSRNTLTTWLTDSGSRVLDAADAAASGVEQRMWDALNPEERAELRSLLARVRDAIGGAE